MKLLWLNLYQKQKKSFFPNRNAASKERAFPEQCYFYFPSTAWFITPMLPQRGLLGCFFVGMWVGFFFFAKQMLQLLNLFNHK